MLIEGLDRPTSLDARRVGSALGLTPGLSRVAVLLAEGKTMAEIAVLSGRTEMPSRAYVKRIHHKLGVSRLFNETPLQKLPLASFQLPGSRACRHPLPSGSVEEACMSGAS